MLQANKAQLLAKLALDTLSIRQVELQYWISVFDKLGVLAAFLGGFASTVMIIVPVESRGQIPLMDLLYTVSASGALGFNMLLLVISAMCCLWGPGKALTGQGTESYNQVICVMETMYKHSIVYFQLGLACYFLSSIFAVFSLFNFIGALVITAVLLISARLLLVHFKAVRELFIPTAFSTGALRGELANVPLQCT